MINNKMIEVKQDLDSIGYDTGIEVKVIPENFDASDKFCKITSSQLDYIMTDESSINKENILIAFLYISSYIFIRPRDKNNNEVLHNPKDKPEAFYKSIESMSKELSMSKDTIIKSIECLISSNSNKKPLLVKREVGSIKSDEDKTPRNVPNIYVLNRNGYEQEIEWAIAKMMEVYNVSSFGELKVKRGKNVKSDSE